jgi:Tol biopolymer transport system component
MMRGLSITYQVRRGLVGSAVAVIVAVLAATSASATTTETKRVSVSTSGAQGNQDSSSPSISENGRFVAFTSDSSNLVQRDTNDQPDVFVRDRWTRTTHRVSVSSSGTQANGPSFQPSISANGRFVAFTSESTNLVPGDINDQPDVFVRDRWTRTTHRVSVSSSGAQADDESGGSSISANGRFVAFDSLASNLVPETTGGTDVFVRDRWTRTTHRVSVSSSGAEGNGQSFQPSISADGRFVAFTSEATNLVPGDTNDQTDMFVRDQETRTTRRVSVSSTGAQGNGGNRHPSISADGRFVAFGSDSSNLVPGDTNEVEDVFLRDRWNRTTRRVSVSSTGAQGNGLSFQPSISANGRFVAFDSLASNLVPGDTNGSEDVFLRDRWTQTTRRVSVSTSGAQGNSHSGASSISGDGRFVAFDSFASNLVLGDTNGRVDVFVRGPLL